MNYKKEYGNGKIVTLEDAVKLVKNNMYIEIGGAGNTTPTIDKYLAKRKDELQNVIVVGPLSSTSFIKLDKPRTISYQLSNYSSKV